MGNEWCVPILYAGPVIVVLAAAVRYQQTRVEKAHEYAKEIGARLVERDSAEAQRERERADYYEKQARGG